MSKKTKKLLSKIQNKSEDFHFDLISNYHKKRTNKGIVLTDRTCNDLDFDDFFMFVDHTISMPGQQYLYNHLRTIPESFDHFKKQESFINFGSMSFMVGNE